MTMIKNKIQYIISLLSSEGKSSIESQGHESQGQVHRPDESQGQVHRPERVNLCTEVNPQSWTG